MVPRIGGKSQKVAGVIEDHVDRNAHAKTNLRTRRL